MAERAHGEDEDEDEKDEDEVDKDEEELSFEEEEDKWEFLSRKTTMTMSLLTRWWDPKIFPLAHFPLPLPGAHLR